MLSSRLIACATLLAPGAWYPTKVPSWPSTISTAIPVRKPTITEWETKRVRLPRRSSPAAICRAPISTTSRNRACSRSAPSQRDTSCPAAIAAALVVVTSISCVLAKRPPAMGPTRLAYRP